MFLGLAGPGGYAEYVTCPPEQLVAVPDGISDFDAAAIQVAFGTAWHMLFTRGNLRIGDRLLEVQRLAEEGRRARQHGIQPDAPVPGGKVIGVEFGREGVIVTVRLRRRRRVCSSCG